MLINIDRKLCIGAAPCVAIAGNVFQLDEEGIAIVVGPSTDDTNTRLAAEACPVRAIFLYNEQKQQLFPPASESPRAYVEENSIPPVTASTAPAPSIPPASPSVTPANDNSAPAQAA